MNIELARTFLEVIATGNFVSAATRLNLTQSTVSMRIKSLEDELGRRLFERTKAGASLTPAGVQFQPFAISLMQIWEQACHHVAVPSGYNSVLTIGGQHSLWDRLLFDLLYWIKLNAPDISIRAEYGLPDWLTQRLLEGMLDIAMMYTPQSRPGLKIEKLFEDDLVHVSSDPIPSMQECTNYIIVDWGPEFRNRLTLQVPDLASSGTVLNLGTLSLRYILNHGGSGHFPMRVVNQYLEEGTLYMVPGSPRFGLPAYVVYSEGMNRDVLDPIKKGLKEIKP